MAGPTEAAHGAAEAAHDAAGAAGMPQLDFSTFPNQIFWLVVTMLAIYFIVSRVAMPRIGGVMADRASVVQNDLDEAANLGRKAKEAEAAYQQALADARAEAQRIAGETRAAIQKEIDAAIAKADAEIAAKAAESEARIAEIRETATRSVEEVAAETGAAIVAALMPDAADDAAVKAAVASAMKG